MSNEPGLGGVGPLRQSEDEASKPVILVIDDETQIRKLLELTLESNGYLVRSAMKANEGLAKVASERPELVILDLGLPDMDGLEVLKKVREWSSVPILILSVRSLEKDIIACLDAGADDYLVKPFRTGELLARVRAAVRHHQTAQGKNIFSLYDLQVDLSARVVKKGNEILKLTATEYALLSLFVKNAGRVLTHKYILEQVWGPSFSEETQYTRVYIGQLRKKIEDDPTTPKIIITESGIGYRFSSEEFQP
ncbi:MAG TPA: response regulator [Candidatus Acidoferrales bacterium]|nr:response regulator [Candidatus Acidoferrales bacterium]